jgi:hypothetical protein
MVALTLNDEATADELRLEWTAILDHQQTASTSRAVASLNTLTEPSA